MAKGLAVVIGDCYGADALVQRFLHECLYRNVTVYYCGAKARNNIGGWPEHQVQKPDSYYGRGYYFVKDMKMRQVADYGFAIWDGKSAGTRDNIVQMARMDKPTLVYLWTKKRFLIVKTDYDANVRLYEEGEAA